MPSLYSWFKFAATLNIATMNPYLKTVGEKVFVYKNGKCVGKHNTNQEANAQVTELTQAKSGKKVLAAVEPKKETAKAEVKTDQAPAKEEKAAPKKSKRLEARRRIAKASPTLVEVKAPAKKKPTQKRKK